MVYNPAGTMNNLKFVVTAIVLGVILISIELGSTDARTISNEDDFFTAPILKRNTWWTKKSLDALDTIPHNTMDIGRGPSDNARETIEIYACYVERCVSSFVACARQAETETLFDACKVLHEMCATSCVSSSRSPAHLGL